MTGVRGQIRDIKNKQIIDTRQSNFTEPVKINSRILPNITLCFHCFLLSTSK